MFVLNFMLGIQCKHMKVTIIMLLHVGRAKPDRIGASLNGQFAFRTGSSWCEGHKTADTRCFTIENV